VVTYGLDLLDPAPSYRFPSELPDYYLVNGLFQPNITMLPGQFKLFRFVGGGTSAFLELQIASGGGGGASGSSEAPTAASCEMYIVAKDGIFVPEAYENQHPLLVPGSRVDVAVRCNQSGHYSLSSQRNAPYDGDLAQTTAVFEGTLAGIVVEGQPVVMAAPRDLPARPSYLPDLRNSTTSNRFTVIFETIGGPFKLGPPFPPMHINQQSFTTKTNFVRKMALGQLEEWKVQIAGDSSVGAGNHPFHVHVNPYQVVDLGGVDEMLGVKVGEYRDTVPLWQSSGYTIRFVPDRFPGPALIHCHMIPHVDLGMGAVASISQSTTSSELTHHTAIDIDEQDHS
jgi:FtsP/CotA-like multicopper oxidase with cupredoxin domain